MTRLPAGGLRLLPASIAGRSAVVDVIHNSVEQPLLYRRTTRRQLPVRLSTVTRHRPPVQCPVNTAWPGPFVRKVSIAPRASSASKRPTAASTSSLSAPAIPPDRYACPSCLTTEYARVGPT